MYKIAELWRKVIGVKSKSEILSPHQQWFELVLKLEKFLPFPHQLWFPSCFFTDDTYLPIVFTAESIFDQLRKIYCTLPLTLPHLL